MAACVEHAFLRKFTCGDRVRPVKVALIAFFAASSLPLAASESHVVDISALVAAAKAGCTETNGWTMSGLDGYADDSLRFNANTDRLLSPIFPSPIARIEANVRSSSILPTRFLQVRDADTGVTNGQFAACAKDDKLELQTLTFDAATKTRQIEFRLGGTGNTGWGLGALTVVTGDSVSPPSGLALERATATQATAVWTNGANCVSNRVDLYSLAVTAEEDTLFACTFDNFTAGGKKNPVPYDDRVADENPPLWGDNLFAPTNFESGVCQLGTGDKLGALHHPGFADCAGLTLRLVARRYPGDNAQTHVSYLAGDETNVVATLTLSDAFEDLQIDLSNVPAYAPIRIGFAGSTKSNRRVWVDGLSFVRRQGEVRTCVASGVFALGTGPVRFSTRALRPLCPERRWALEVRGISSEGAVSTPVGLTFGTHGSGGMAWFVQ